MQRGASVQVKLCTPEVSPGLCRFRLPSAKQLRCDKPHNRFPNVLESMAGTILSLTSVCALPIAQSHPTTSHPPDFGALACGRRRAPTMRMRCGAG